MFDLTIHLSSSNYELCWNNFELCPKIKTQFCLNRLFEWIWFPASDHWQNVHLRIITRDQIDKVNFINSTQLYYIIDIFYLFEHNLIDFLLNPVGLIQF